MAYVTPGTPNIMETGDTYMRSIYGKQVTHTWETEKNGEASVMTTDGYRLRMLFTVYSSIHLPSSNLFHQDPS